MLNKLKSELLDAAPEACLPRNLSEEWRDYLAGSADNMLKEDEDEDDTQDKGAAILAVILRILDAKRAETAGRVEVPFEELHAYVQRYRLELALEELHRKTDITYNPATIETILTEREVTTWKKLS
ncbi:hypothetical protein K6V18_06585 [Ralstonia insidiosa]|uniref:hypothetical protein n=1 Tax=Ralstonia TaxID=48736 RepID=UPI00066BD930|nr:MULTISPECIES: hypothetical protein [Ralstonia]MBY4704669.1 hypothetical protein [Ralstonia insidiosa]GAQ30433.1 hypothetical protein SAMD00023378_4116 [Ralstonia sp. NT80]